MVSKGRTEIKSFICGLTIASLISLLTFGVVGAFCFYTPMKWVYCKITRKSFEWPEFLLEEDT